LTQTDASQSKMAPKKTSTAAISERIIELVRDNPAIYDATRPEHRDAVMMANIWKSITKDVGPGVTGEYSKT